MSDQEESEVGIALGVVFGIIALVIALVIGVAIHKSNAPAAPATAMAGDDAYSEIAEVGAPLTKLYFALGETALPANAETELTNVKAVFEAKPGAVVLLSGFHDESGTVAVNEQVAKDRAKSVKAALIAAGLPADQVLMRKPTVTLGGVDAAEARRVEVRVQ